MNVYEIEALRKHVNFANMADPRNVEALGQLSVAQREEFALATQSMVLYFGNEVATCKNAEEAAALAAAPKGCALEDLNGLNIGCGDRTISPYLTQVDIMRSPPNQLIGGEHKALTANALLAHSHDLPFRPDSVDYIVSLHGLEHLSDPVQIILHWLDIVKPGGGIGVVVPNWRYAWDARNDRSPYGHKWNSTPELVDRLYQRHWSAHCALEALDTLPFKLSFDFVLRKHGDFQQFSRASLEAALSGRQLFEAGRFLGSAD